MARFGMGFAPPPTSNSQAPSTSSSSSTDVKININVPMNEEQGGKKQRARGYAGVYKPPRKEITIVRPNEQEEQQEPYSNKRKRRDDSNRRQRSRGQNYIPLKDEDDEPIIPRNVPNEPLKISVRYTDEDAQGLPRANSHVVDLTVIDPSWNLTEEMTKVWHENPHVRQNMFNKRPVQNHGRQFAESDRLINDQCPRMKYQRRKAEAKTVEQWKQRQTLISEIEFLTKFADKANPQTVLVAGAAVTANHIHILVDLFPNIQWKLIDQDFGDAMPLDNVEFMEGEFTDEIVKQWEYKAGGDEQKKNTLFISHISSLPTSKLEAHVQDEFAAHDMALQQQLVLALRPAHSMLNFKLPFSEGRTTYLDGEQRFNIWNGNTSTDSVLYVSRQDDLKTTAPAPVDANGLRRIVFLPSTDPAFPFKQYDHTKHEEILYHFNVVTRPSLFQHSYAFTIEKFDHKKSTNVVIDHCYDCAAELFVLNNYIQSKKQAGDQMQEDNGTDSKEVEELSKSLAARFKDSSSKSSTSGKGSEEQSMAVAEGGVPTESSKTSGEQEDEEINIDSVDDGEIKIDYGD
eukprot:TRINITY_DN6334_c0_g1_i1.p1 TRINITY_DN6334_c0_g1~~TRINITY_DN6334_c0_g1_i1.p1  ORF type:complete len:591 (+),score=168.21 TRINITY_DN6334_c0_g1_i1:63-1775(+)